MRAVGVIAALLLLLGGGPGAGCGDDAPGVDGGADAPVDARGGVDLTQPVHVDVDEDPPELLSDYNLFSWDPVEGFAYNDRVVPYDLNTALFSDYALKQRALYVPEGETATYQPELAFDFPVGSVAIKNFYFAADLRAPDEDRTLVETRLIVRYPDGWHPLPYIWDEDQGDAVLTPAGDTRTIAFLDAEGEPREASYLIPQRNQCGSCHSRKETLDADAELVLIGPKARHLHRDGQLEQLAELDMLSGLPDVGEITAAYDFRPIEEGGVEAIPAEDLDTAARDYLDINCAHCHNPNGVQGITSQLFLNHDNDDAFNLGVCKRPGSAGPGTGGFTFDIVPGDASTSILHFRVATTQVGAMMPLLGRSLTHDHGAELIGAWIDAMPPETCEEPP